MFVSSNISLELGLPHALKWHAFWRARRAVVLAECRTLRGFERRLRLDCAARYRAHEKGHLAYFEDRVARLERARELLRCA